MGVVEMLLGVYIVNMLLLISVGIVNTFICETVP
jgi:hypothetical protein